MASAEDFIGRVLSGEQPACKWIRLACQRQRNDLAKQAGASFPYRFDEGRAARVCRFIESLPHIKGEWARARDNRIKLEGWQCFVLTTVFGWVHKETGYRRFREAYVKVPRKNGKSMLAGGVGDYMFAADGEMGAEVYTGATCERQAWEVFGPAKQMVERSPRLKELFGIRVGSKSLSIAKNGSKFETLIGDPGDGQSPSCAIVDEYHEHRTDRLVDTMRTGMGARTQPLLWIITTAGATIGGPCHSFERDCERVLEGTIERDELFAAMWGVDTGDDWTAEASLVKANPNFGVSVFPHYLIQQQQQAIQSSRKQNIFLTKHLNVWVGANTAFMNMAKWAACADAALTPKSLGQAECFAAVDLSSKLDITALVRIFRKKVAGEMHYYVFGRYYLPEARTLEPELDHYAGWAHDGHLHTTPGHTIDYQTIQDDAEAWVRESKISQFAFDPWNAEQFAQELAGKTRTIAVEVPNQTRALSEPMKQLEALVIAGRLHHDGNPVLTWMMGNVVAHPDAKDNLFPNKEKPENKIDGAVAVIMALSRALVGAPKKSVYSTRGVLTL